MPEAVIFILVRVDLKYSRVGAPGLLGIVLVAL